MTETIVSMTETIVSMTETIFSIVKPTVCAVSQCFAHRNLVLFVAKSPLGMLRGFSKSFQKERSQ
jgi:hypothetical protein